MKLKIEATAVFERSWNTTGRIVVHRGSTRSSKTWSVCQQLAIWLMTGQIRKGHHIPEGAATVVRKHQTTLRKTVEKDFIDVLVDMGVYGLVSHNKTNREVSFQNRQVNFIGADDQQKIRGYKSRILYCNEANELNYDAEFFQLFIRTTDLTILDLNPSDPYVWINERIEQERARQDGDVDVIVSTFLDNPYLSAAQVAEIKRLEAIDPQLWLVYGLGQYGKIEGLVYPNFTIVDSMPDALAKRGYGLDFGFGGDPAAMVDCGVQNKTDLYLDELIYSTDLTNPELSTEMEAAGAKRYVTIYADSAEPKSIKELQTMRWQIMGATKGADSIRYGIDTLRQYNLFVTARSVNLIRELRKYKWATDNSGRVLQKPIDSYNHLLDAARYYAIMNLSVAGRSRLPQMAS